MTTTPEQTPPTTVSAFEAPTRPKTAPVGQPRTPERAVVRYTLDLEKRQNQFFKVFCLTNDVQGSRLMRTFLHALEDDPEFAEMMLRKVRGEDEPTDA